MRGIIYKDVCLFFKGLDKRIFILAGVVVVLLVVSNGAIAGLMISIMLAMAVGMQHVLTFSVEDKAEWEKYLHTMPVQSGQVIAGKYAAVIVTLLVSIIGSLLCNLIVSAVYQTFSLPMLELSIVCAVAVPLCWTAVSLPACYWFGFQTAQYVGIVLLFPIFYTVKYFEDSPNGFPLNLSIAQYVPFAAACVAALFAASYLVSLTGYLWRVGSFSRKKHA